MYKNNNGFVPGAVLFLPLIKKMREDLEFQKYIARVLVDDDRTRNFRLKTENHKNKLFALRYNNERSESLTAAGKKNGS